MVIGNIGQLGHENTIQISFMLFVYDINHIVILIQTFRNTPDSLVDIPQPENAYQTIVVISRGTYEQKFTVSQALGAHYVFNALAYFLYELVLLIFLFHPGSFAYFLFNFCLVLGFSFVETFVNVGINILQEEDNDFLAL
jgi:hypothetical protein